MLWHSGRLIALCIASAALVSACGGSQSSPGLESGVTRCPRGQSRARRDSAALKSSSTCACWLTMRSRGEVREPRGMKVRCAMSRRRSHPTGSLPPASRAASGSACRCRNSIVVEDASAMTVSSAREEDPRYGMDYLLGADLLREQVSIDDAPVAFVGYGVSAPALGYDDYGAGVDVKGKVVAYLSGAPAKLPSNERAYYSSGAVKEAEAARRGAIGTISFTSPDDPRFRWDVSVATGKQGGFAWVDAQGNPNRGDPALRGSASLNHSGVAALFAGAPKAPAAVFAAAAKSTPQAFDLPTRVTLVTRSTHKDVESANLVARLEGERPRAEGRTRRLRRPRGSLRAWRRDERRRHLQRCARQRLRRRDRARGRARVFDAADAAAALHAVPVRDRRGAGTARLRLLRAESDGAPRAASWPTSRSTCRSCSTRCSTSCPTARSTRRSRRR